MTPYIREEPKISIVTICRDNLEDVIKTCDSVDNQFQKPYEHIIIDGSETDIIKNYFSSAPKPIYRKCYHERDNGIADAFNRGISRVSGEIIQLLNAGDTFFDSTSLEIIKKTFMHNPEINWLHSLYRMKRGGKWVILGKTYDETKLYRGMRSICHQTMFVRKSLYEKYGPFNTKLKISMDYDYLIKIRKEPFLFLKTPTIIYDADGVSARKYSKSLQEGKMVYESYFGYSWKLRLWQIRLRLLHNILKTKTGKFIYKLKLLFRAENF